MQVVLSSFNDAAVHLPPTRQLPPVGTAGQFWISSAVVVGQAVAPVADLVAPLAALHKSAHSKQLCSFEPCTPPVGCSSVFHVSACWLTGLGFRHTHLVGTWPTKPGRDN